MKKIPTLFEREFENHKIIGIKDKITKGCEDAFYNGAATIKYDGSCCAIIDGVLYKRYDAKKGKPIPAGAIKCQDEPDPITGHLPCWVKCDADNPADKWFIKGAESIHISKATGITTFEAIGKHFNGNPYQREDDIMIEHGRSYANVERTFEGVREWLKNNYEEGLVFWLNDEPVCKIKRSDFGFEWGLKK